MWKIILFICVLSFIENFAYNQKVGRSNGLLVCAAILCIIIFLVLRKEIRENREVRKAEAERKRREQLRKASPKVNYAKEPKSYPSGWTFNENTKLWEPPDKVRSDNKNRMTEQGTYRYDYYHVPSKEIKPEHKQAAAKETTFKEKENDSVIENDQSQIKSKNQESNQNKESRKGYEDAYEVRPILTYNESRNYKTLKEAADRKGYTVNVKTRLADIVKPREGQHYDKYYEANFRRISQYHVDFTILNDRMKIIAIIELDDSSHDRPDRQARDEKVENILKANNIKIIHTRHITPDI